MKQSLSSKSRLVKYFIAGLVVLVVVSAFGFRDRDFKTVTFVSYQDSPNAAAVSNLTSEKVAPSGFAGEYGVEMTGKVHDGYLELRINRERGTETQIVPMNRVWRLSFFEPK